MKPTKLTVSVVTYQQEDTIQDALDSVLLQETDFDYEIIVGDDASTDRTREILEKYRTMCPASLKLILRNTNAGDFGITNVLATIDAADSEYIAFLDGDDYWTDPKKLQKQVAFLDAHPECALCAHRVEHLHTDGVRILSPNAPNGSGTYDVGALMVKNFAPKISTIVRKSALADLPEWYRTTQIVSADWLLNILVGRHGYIGFINEVMAVHTLNKASVSLSFGAERMLSDKLKALAALRDHFPQKTADLKRLERRLNWKLRAIRFSPSAFTAMKRLNGLARPRPR